MNIIKKTFSAILGFALFYNAAGHFDLTAKAADTTVLVTEYSDLWSGNISVKAGDTVKWHVNVPEGTQPKGCGATIKIPDLGWGTDTHNKEEGHLTLTQGDNFVYEFTPEETGDILFTCWMGSSCHHNYIHVTADGTYNVPKPADASDISAEWDGSKATVSFTAPQAPEGARITGYKVTATDESGKRKKVSVKESPAVFEELDQNQSYTFRIITQATSGNSAGENEFVLAADKETENAPSEVAEQKIVTEYDQLWTGNITVKAGVPAKWYVNVPEGTELIGCARTIKIPGLGWGTDSSNKNEGHLTLEHGENFVYEFTPEEEGDILFTCWMGSQCHYNYIHVTADGTPDPDAKTGGRGNAMTTAATTAAPTATTTTIAPAKRYSSPKTGEAGAGAAEAVLGISALILLFSSRSKRK